MIYSLCDLKESPEIFRQFIKNIAKYDSNKIFNEEEIGIDLPDHSGKVMDADKIQNIQKKYEKNIEFVPSNVKSDMQLLNGINRRIITGYIPIKINSNCTISLICNMYEFYGSDRKIIKRYSDDAYGIEVKDGNSSNY